MIEIIFPILLIAMMCYMGLVFFFQWGLKKSTPPLSQSISSDCFITVVVAFRNEAQNLPRLLNNLQSQSLATNRFEILLVNDHSTDQWQQAMAPFQLPNLKIINANQQGKKQAIAQACKVAKGHIIVTTDADCQLQPLWLATISEQMQTQNADLLIGPVNLLSDGSWLQNIQQLDYRALQLCSAGAAKAHRPIMCSGANLAFRPEAYQQIHNNLKFDYLSGDDMFLLHAAKTQGMKIGFADHTLAVVHTPAEKSIRSFINQRIRWASKSKAYTDGDTIAVAIVVLMANASWVALMCLGLTNGMLFGLFVLTYLLKSIIEWQLFKTGETLFEKVTLMKFLSTMPVHPFYTVGVAMAGFCMNVNWKGRRVETTTPIREGQVLL